MTADQIIQRISQALDHATDIERENRSSEYSDPVSKAFDAGRVDGLRQALDIALQEAKQ